MWRQGETNKYIKFRGSFSSLTSDLHFSVRGERKGNYISAAILVSVHFASIFHTGVNLVFASNFCSSTPNHTLNNFVIQTSGKYSKKKNAAHSTPRPLQRYTAPNSFWGVCLHCGEGRKQRNKIFWRASYCRDKFCVQASTAGEHHMLAPVATVALILLN